MRAISLMLKLQVMLIVLLGVYEANAWGIRTASGSEPPATDHVDRVVDDVTNDHVANGTAADEVPVCESDSPSDEPLQTHENAEVQTTPVVPPNDGADSGSDSGHHDPNNGNGQGGQVDVPPPATSSIYQQPAPLSTPLESGDQDYRPRPSNNSGGSPGTNTGPVKCDKWGGVYPGMKVRGQNYPSPGITTAFSLLPDLFNPTTDEMFDIRNYQLPESQPKESDAYCVNGGCWACLTSPRNGYSTESTIETCNHDTNRLYQERATVINDGKQRMGNWSKWTFKKGNIGPDGVQLYDLYSTPSTEPTYSEELALIYSDIAIAVAKVDNDENSSSWITRFDEIKELGDSYVLFEACTGRVLINAYGVNEGGCVFTPDAHKAGWWSIRPPVEDHIFSNADPIQI